MRLKPDDRVAGLPAHAARELMRRFWAPAPETVIGEFVESDDRGAAEIARALEADGWLHKHSDGADGEVWWQTTTRGNALAQAGFGKPITRATAARNLAAVIARAEAFNADTAHLIEIAEVVVFGSYLDPAVNRLGDLDIGVTLRNRMTLTMTGDEQIDQRLRYARTSGRRFSTFLDQLQWPEHEAVLTLRNRSGVINITTENVSDLTDRWETVYRHDHTPS